MWEKFNLKPCYVIVHNVMMENRSCTEPKQNKLNINSGNLDIFETGNFSEYTQEHTDSILCKCLNCCTIVGENEPKSRKGKLPNKFHHCNKCDKFFERAQKLVDHYASVHSNARDFVCDVCSKGFPTKGSLESHINYLHFGKFYEYKCSKCDVILKNQTTLGKHQRKFHSIQQFVSKRVSCDQCLKSYSRKADLLQHKNDMHDRTKKFTCDHCSSVFYKKKSLTYHMFVKHLPPSLMCIECSKLFHTQGQLYLHLSKEHKIKTLGVEHTCEQCGKIVKNKTLYLRHLKSHDNARDYSCKVCSKKFKFDYHLSQHSKTHSDVRRFSCDLCSQSFKFKHHLEQHMSVHGVQKSKKYGKRIKKLVDSV